MPDNWQAGLSTRLDAVASGAAAAERIVGSVVIVKRDGEEIYAGAHGFADREQALPMDTGSLFRLASVSKLFTSVCALILVDQGHLSLDRPITEWLPDFQPPFEGKRPVITLRNLLTHTSGLGYRHMEEEGGPLSRAGVSDGLDLVTISMGENLSRLASVPLQFRPGSAFRYSLGIDVAGAIVERVTSRNLPDAVNDLLLEPLGLSDTGFHAVDAGRLCTAYIDGPVAPAPLVPDARVRFGSDIPEILLDPRRALEPRAFASGGAGMVSSARDVISLLDGLLHGRVLSGPMIGEMSVDQIPAYSIDDLPGWGHGLAGAVLRDPVLAGVRESIGSWRWDGVYGSSWMLDWAQRMAIVAMTNTTAEGLYAVGRFSADISRATYAALEIV